MDLQQAKAYAKAVGVSVHLVVKEQIHLFVLEHLSRKGAFSNLVFQGGTALRIAYGGVRYSDDLDFVLRKKSKAFFGGFTDLLEGLPASLRWHTLFGKEIALKAQKRTPTFLRFILIVPVEGILDKTNIELAHVPSYENKPIIVRNEGSLGPAIRVETPAEIFSDKIVAFGAQKYVKGRDIWDIHFLLETLNVALAAPVRDMAVRKIADYGLARSDFKVGFQKNLLLLEKEGAEILKVEMERFLPLSVRDLFKRKYFEISRTVWGALRGFTP